MTEGDLHLGRANRTKFYGRTAIDRDYNGLVLDNREAMYRVSRGPCPTSSSTSITA